MVMNLQVTQSAGIFFLASRGIIF